MRSSEPFCEAGVEEILLQPESRNLPAWPRIALLVSVETQIDALAENWKRDGILLSFDFLLPPISPRSLSLSRVGLSEYDGVLQVSTRCQSEERD